MKMTAVGRTLGGMKVGSLSEQLDKLVREHLTQVPAGLLRTLHRRIKEWRTAAARRLELGGTDATSAGAIPGEAAGNIGS